MPTFRVAMTCSQQGPALLTAKYCISTRGEMDGGGTGTWIKARPGRARCTNLPINVCEQILTSRGTLEIKSASPTEASIPKIQRDRSNQRWSVPRHESM